MSPTYNKKAFLLPNSPNSCAMYHAKIDSEGMYKLSIHDCNTGIRFGGDLKSEESRAEAFKKLEVLISGLVEFQDFIYQKYIQQ